MPSRPWPSANPGPTMSRRIPRLSMRVVAKRSALHSLNSRVNGMTTTRSAPPRPSSSKRSSTLQSRGGQPDGSTTQRGCGSNVTATVAWSVSGSRRPHALEQTLMADVHAVEAADRHNRTRGARLPRGELMEQFHRAAQPASTLVGLSRPPFSSPMPISSPVGSCMRHSPATSGRIDRGSQTDWPRRICCTCAGPRLTSGRCADRHFGRQQRRPRVLHRRELVECDRRAELEGAVARPREPAEQPARARGHRRGRRRERACTRPCR